MKWVFLVLFAMPAQAQTIGFGSKLTTEVSGFELGVYPSYVWLNPHVEVEKTWVKGTVSLGSLHYINYPTFMLRTFAYDGTLAVIDPAATVPNMLSFDNRLVLSWTRGKIRAHGALGGFHAHRGGTESFNTIDAPVLFPRTRHYQGPPTWLGELRGGYKLGTFDFELTYDRFVMSKLQQYELWFWCTWQLSKSFALRLGAIHSGGDYPFGKAYATLPLFDFRWRI